QRKVEHPRAAVDDDQPQRPQGIKRPHAKTEERKADYLLQADAPPAGPGESPLSARTESATIFRRDALAAGGGRRPAARACIATGDSPASYFARFPTSSNLVVNGMIFLFCT